MLKRTNTRRQHQNPAAGALQAKFSQGVALQRQGKLADAERVCWQILRRQPNHFDALHLLGVIAIQTKQTERGVELITKAIGLNAKIAAAHNSVAIGLQDLKRAEEALASYDKAIVLKPDYAEAYYNRGIALQDLKRPEEALASYDKAIALKPDYAKAYSNRGNVLGDLKRPEEALASYDKAIALKPNYAEAHSNRGNALLDLKRREEALASYDKAIALKPDCAEAHSGRGNLLRELRRFEEALASCDKAIALKPDYAKAHSNRGNVLRDLKRPEEALASYDKAIRLKPDYVEAHSNRGNALLDLKRPEDALASYDKAISLKPDFVEAHGNRGIALKDLMRFEEALASYDRAMILKPDLAKVEGLRLHTKMHLCDWSNFDTECAHLISAIRNGNVNTLPFEFLGISASCDDQLRCAKLWSSNNYPPSERPIWQGERYDHDRIRVAYLSADFHLHSTALLVAELFEMHDRSRFEVIGVSFGVDDRSEIRKRLVAAFDQYHDVQRTSNKDVAKLLYDLQVDIAVDLKGYTYDSRFGIFACRPAPIQVNYLGYHGSMGTPVIDYIIADKIVIPADHRQFFTEKIVHLPNCFQVNDSKRAIGARAPARRDVGLPEHKFVFCCFNNSYKITPAVYDIWMRILRQVDDSVLWLLEENGTTSTNLRKEAEARGVDAARIIFSRRIPLPEHLARHNCAGLFLDTLHWTANTTASTALWAGLPVLSCLGETFAGRVAASLLNAIDLPELVTTTPEAYEALAIELATNPEKLAKIKRKLADNRLTTPLFDTKRFAKHIEAAYTTMYERYLADLAPADIYVPNS